MQPGRETFEALQEVASHGAVVQEASSARDPTAWGENVKNQAKEAIQALQFIIKNAANSEKKFSAADVISQLTVVASNVEQIADTIRVYATDEVKPWDLMDLRGDLRDFSRELRDAGR